MTLGFFSFSYLSNLFIENNNIKDFKKTGILKFLVSINKFDKYENEKKSQSHIFTKVT